MSNTYLDTGLDFYQHTLADSFMCIGVGLHSGLKVGMSVLPAEPNTGYTFYRRDVRSMHAEVPARWHNVSSTNLSTTVVNKSGIRVSTIEHLLAALKACGVDNAHITLDGPEVPILDGSAKPFVELIKQVGLKKQDELRRAIIVHQTISVAEDESQAELNPYTVPWIKMEIDFESDVVGKQHYSFPLSAKNFEEQLSNARTFGFEDEVQALRKLGFARGGSLNNAVVVGKDKVLNLEGLRHHNEFVRHKCLDAIGDMALVGATILGEYYGRRAGHRLNNLLMRELMSRKDCIEHVSLRDAHDYWRGHQASPSRNETCFVEPRDVPPYAR